MNASTSAIPGTAQFNTITQAVPAEQITSPVSPIKSIYVFGEVNESISREIIQELVEHNWETTTHMHIFICTEGGNLHDCFAIIDFIENIKVQFGIHICSFGLGEVVSAGFLLFLLGDTRVMFPNCRMFVHEHITINQETQTYGQRLKADKGEEKNVYQLYVNYITRRLGITMRKSKTLLRKCDWLSEKDIVSYNIVPRIKENE